jgi:hypothetical protein
VAEDPVLVSFEATVSNCRAGRRRYGGYLQLPAVFVGLAMSLGGPGLCASEAIRIEDSSIFYWQYIYIYIIVIFILIYNMFTIYTSNIGASG